MPADMGHTGAAPAGRYDGRVSEPTGAGALDRQVLEAGATGVDLGLERWLDAIPFS